MYNLRYHVASLVAVFLFLAVGLLLGTIVAERGTLDTQRDTLISGLREQFEGLSDENALLRQENEVREDYVNDTLPLLVAGQLDGGSVLVISNTGRTDGLTATREAVSRAGASTGLMLMQVREFGLGDTAVSELATAYVGVAAEDDPDAFRTEVAERLADELLNPALQRPLLEALAAAGVVDIEGLEPDVAITGVITMASWGEAPDAMAIALSRALAARGVPAAGVEATTQHTGVAAAAVESGLSAIEGIGSPESDFSLVMVLAGRAEGHFGDSPAAGARYPDVEPVEE